MSSGRTSGSCCDGLSWPAAPATCASGSFTGKIFMGDPGKQDWQPWRWVFDLDFVHNPQHLDIVIGRIHDKGPRLGIRGPVCGQLPCCHPNTPGPDITCWTCVPQRKGARTQRTQGALRHRKNRLYVQYVQAHGHIARREVSELCRITSCQAGYLLRKMAERGLLCRVGQGRATVYEKVQC